MKIKTTGIVIGSIVLVGAGTYLVFFHKGKDGKTVIKRLIEGGRELSREDAIEILKKYLESKNQKIGNTDGIETGYLVERAKAIKSDREVFFFKDRYYLTSTGKATAF